MGADTDPDIEAQILAAIGSKKAPPAVNGAPLAETDPNIEAQVRAHLAQAATPPTAAPGASPAPNVPSDSVTGPNGLMWNRNGGYDPKTGELVIAGKPFSDPAAENPTLAKVVAAGEGTLSGVPVVGPTLAAAPVMAAAMARTAISGTPADQTLSGMNSIVSNSEAANPGLTTAGNVAGAVAGTIPLASTVLGARGLGLVGGIPSRAIQGGIGGGALSAADSYMRGGDPIESAKTGAGLGAVIPFFGGAIGSAAKGLMSAVPTAVTGPLSSLNQTARNMLAVAAQGETPASLDAAHQALGPSGFVGDLSNPLSRLTKSIADQPITAAGDIRAAYNQRAATDGGRIESAISSAIGPRQNLTLLARNDKIAQSQAADPLYEAWRQTPVPPTDDLRALMPRLNAAGVSGSAANKMAISGTPGYQQWFKTDPTTGQMTLDTEASPTAQTWDFMKQALDDKVSAARRAGENGNARLYQGLKSDLVGAIDNHPDPNVAGV